MKFQSRVLLEGEIIREIVKLSIKMGMVHGVQQFRRIAAVGGFFCCAGIAITHWLAWNAVDFAGFLIGAGLLSFGVSVRLTETFFAWLIGRKMRMGERTYSYYDDRIESMRHGAQTLLAYEAIGRVISYRDRFYLLMGAERAFCLVSPMDSFRVGNADDFKQFIQEKTEKTVEYMY